MQPSLEEAVGMRTAQRVGLFLGAGAFLLMLMLPAPEGLTPVGWRTAAVATLMAAWWMTEAIDISATALLPLVLFPLLGILDMGDTSAPYANDLIFLYMGGFFIAFAMEKWGLHKRIALRILAAVGSGPERVILGFMLATAFLSMWISNTATTAMMLPIAMAVAELFRPLDRSGPYEFGTSIMLAIAYAATIGGVATLIGTPPNAVMAAAASELLGREIGFGQWMILGLPISALLLPLTWFLLVKFLYPPGEVAGDAAGLLQRERAKLGAMSRGEKMVAVVFVLTVLAWMFRAPKEIGALTIPGIASIAPNVRDSTIAMAAGLILFLAPTDWKRGKFALDWATASRIPWGVLVLFGGGLSLARAMDTSGLAAWIGGGIAGLGSASVVVLALAVAVVFIFLTELTSNLATASMAMPIMVGVAAARGVDPLTLMIAAALASSMAFMLPVATPPNAIVFGSGYLTVPQMARAGIVLNLIAIVVVTVAAAFAIPFVFGG